MLTLALAVALIGVDPLRMTLISVALTVVVMPFVVFPFLVLMNDDRFVREHKSGPVANGVLALLTILGTVLALVVIPLEIFGS